MKISTPDARRIVLVVTGCAAVAGAALLSAGRLVRPGLEAWLRKDLSTRLSLVVAAVTILTSGPLLGLAGYLWRLGGRTIRAERYPPPGLRLLRDTTVTEGPAARRRGRLIQAGAVILGLCALVLAFLLWRLVSVVLVTPLS